MYIKPFLDENFLLDNNIAEQLYYGFAQHQPIIDYHNHLSPKDIATDKQFSTITEVWLQGDHYKWRAMRANGIHEKYITGDASDEDKFSKWAETVPKTIRNPLFHWTHLELQRYFSIHELLNDQSAKSIFQQTNTLLKKPTFSAKGLLRQMKVEVVCTTDDPTDDLIFHKMQQASDDNIKMLPTFRPDKFLQIDQPDFLLYLNKLEEIAGNDINTFDQLVAALESRIEYFNEHGCKISDHGLNQLFAIEKSSKNLDAILNKRKNSKNISKEDAEYFQMELLTQLAKLYHKKGWTMQLHLGPIRNNNSRLMQQIGADVGCDSIGDYNQAEGLSYFLNLLDSQDQLTQTILYNLNPSDNALFATMTGNFNDGSVSGKIQWGSAWWFLDQKDGMEKQINALSNFGLLSQFVGMLTDSRSFLSFPRHEYFRRILCNLIGKDVELGYLPNDLNLLGAIIEDICYRNAKNYFKF